MEPDVLKELDDDEGFAAIVDQIRTDRAARGLDPDTGLTPQP